MEYEFIVTVQVNNWPDGDDEYNRAPEDYAKDALNSAYLREAKYLDGYADLEGVDAWITDVVDWY